MKNRIYIISIFLLGLISSYGQNTNNDSINNTVNTNQSLLDSTRQTIDLKEVVVTGKTPQVKIEGAITTVRIQGTQLSRIGNANKILANTPGLHLGGEGIEVNGMGKPIFVMNGREIDPNKVFPSLKGNRLKEIKINKSPDNEYSASGQPIVEVVLTKPLDDYFSLDFGYDPSIHRHFEQSGDVSIGFQMGNFASNVTVLGGNSVSENRESYFRNIYHDNHITDYTQQRTALSKGPFLSVRWASDLKINKNNTLGFEYYYRHTSEKYNQKGSDILNTYDSYNDSFINSIDDSSDNLHNFALQYKLKRGKWTMQLVQEFTLTDKNSCLRSDESYFEDSLSPYSSVLTWTNKHYWTSSSNLKFTVKLPWKLNMTAGAKYVFVSSKRNTSSDNPFLYDGNYHLLSDVDEHTPEAYASLRRTFGNFRISAGITYRLVKRNTTSHQAESSPKNVSYTQSNIIPTLSVNYSKNDWNAYVRYNQNVRQPDFGMLNSGLTYLDSLTYSDGNPDLKATKTYTVRGGVSWKFLSLSARWRYSANPIAEIYEQMNPGSDIIVGKSINLSKSKEFSLSLGFSKTFSIFNLYTEWDMNCPSDSYVFLDKEMNANKIYFTGNVNASVDITDNFGAYTSFTYQGRHTSLTYTQRSAYNWTVGLTASFLKNRLTASLEYTDIFHKANYNNLIYRYGNVESGTYGTNDFSGISLSISYSIFNKKIRANTQRQNDELIFRLN